MWHLKESHTSIRFEKEKLVQTLLTQFIVRSSFIQPFGVAATITPDNDLSSFFTFLARTTT